MRNVAKLAVLALTFSLFQVLPVSAASPPPHPQAERFIVVLEDGVDSHSLARRAIDTTGGRVGFVYEHSINGFMIEMPATAVTGLKNMPGVASIEPDVAVTVATQTESTGYDRIDADLNPGGADYGAIDIAIIDTGVWYDTAAGQSHEDLRLRWVTDCTGAILYPLFGGCTGGGVDGNGHGTHVAGIAAACDNGIGSRGIAPCATLWSFKALADDGSGFLASILAAVDLVAANSDQIDVANMSLSFVGESQALTDAIDAAVAKGVVFVVAAGNDSHDASLSSPASVDSAITVSSVTDYDGMPGGLASATCYSDLDDQFAAYSNYGPKVDIAAPGTCIYSTWLNNTYATVNGTSMASPTVAGAVARYLLDNNLDPATAAEVAAVRDTLVDGGMPQSGECGFGGDTDGFPEPLLFMNGAAFGGDGTCEGGGPVSDDPPIAAVGVPSCTDLACTFDGSGSTDDFGIVSYSWDFGDGTTGTGIAASHTYTTAGQYPVTLTVTDTNNVADSDSTTITVTEPPVSDDPPIAVVGVPSCTDLACTFDGSGSTDDFGIVSYSWDFGDGTTGTGIAASHTYTTAGRYPVTLTVTDTNNVADSDSTTITVTEPPTGDIVMTAGVDLFSHDGTWATVVFFVATLDFELVDGAEATGTWTYTDRRGRTRYKSVTAASDANGLVTIRTRFKGSPPLEFCIDNITKEGYVYVAGPLACTTNVTVTASPPR